MSGLCPGHMFSSQAHVSVQLRTLDASTWVVKTFPIYVSSFIVFSTVYGGAFYQEYKEVTETGKILFPVALVIQLFGMVLLFQREPKASEAVIVEPSSKTDMVLDIKTLNSDPESVRASLPDSHGVGRQQRAWSYAWQARTC